MNVWALINKSDRIFTTCGQVRSDPLSLWPCLHFVLRSNERQRKMPNFTLSSLKGSVNCYVTWVLCKVCCTHLHLPKHILFLTSVQVCQLSALHKYMPATVWWSRSSSKTLSELWKNIVCCSYLLFGIYKLKVIKSIWAWGNIFFVVHYH